MGKPVLFERAELDRLKAALDSVRSNAQALAAVDASLAAAARLRGVLLSEGGAFREQAAADIASARDVVKRTRPALVGSPTSPAGKAWSDAKPKVLYLWIAISLVEKGIPADVDLGDGWTDAVGVALRELPDTIGNAVGVAARTVKRVVAPVVQAAAGVTGSVLWTILRELWPVVLAGAAVGGGYLYFTGRLSAPLALLRKAIRRG